MLESKQDLELFRKLKRQKDTISDTIVKEGGRVLFIPKAIRYFITAVPFDLERPNTIQLRVSKEYYHIVHSTLNSNLFYWWWRVNGNGFQVEMKDILSFPILNLETKLLQNSAENWMMQLMIVEFSNIMLASRFQISIIISNKICCKR